MINGAPATDNYGRYLLPLYIEDAIQETTTSVSGVSAEYGRFTGGVVNALTKSGGNEFHGSLRVNFGNPKWTAPTPLTIERTDELDTQWEGTLGGYILKDRLWFFLGGRTATQTSSFQTNPPVNIPYDLTVRQDRYEGKLTLALSPKHRLIGSYLDVEETRENWLSGYSFYDLETLFTMTAPESIMVLNYSGVLSNTDSETVTWLAPPTIAKAFLPASIVTTKATTFSKSTSVAADNWHVEEGVGLDGSYGIYLNIKENL